MPPRTKRSTPRLSEAARHVVIPEGIVSTGWPAIREQCARMGVEFDPWQDGVGQIAFGKRKDGQYAATVGGVVLSIPRQVGKTFLVGMIVVAFAILHPGSTVLWTAHRTRTSSDTFRTLQGIAKRSKVAPHLLAIRTANGEQEIAFRNGSRIMFGAREQGFGRGFHEVDIEVFDEAQILTEKALEDMIAATNQSRHPAGALLFFMGTPPRPSDPGEAFAFKRQQALEGKDQDTAYVEFSADPDADPDDRKQWAKANPSFPKRTPLASMLRLRANLPSVEAWMREALGVWDAKSDGAVIDPYEWSDLADESSLAIERLTLCVDINPERTHATVALAGRRADGLWHVEVRESRRGTSWVVPYIVERAEKNDLHAVVIDNQGGASTLIEALAQERITVTSMSTSDVKRACGQLMDAVLEQTLRHIDQPALNLAVSVSRKRKLGEAWAWTRRAPDDDIGPTVAVTYALWGAQNSNVKKPARRKNGSRKVVVYS